MPEDFPDHPARVTRVTPRSLAEANALIARDSAPFTEAIDVDTGEHFSAASSALKEIWSQRRIYESRAAGPFFGPRRPFFPPHLVVARGRR